MDFMLNARPRQHGNGVSKQRVSASLQAQSMVLEYEAMSIHEVEAGGEVVCDALEVLPPGRALLTDKRLLFLSNHADVSTSLRPLTGTHIEQ